MNALITRLQLFNAYVLIESSKWWDNKMMLKRTADFLKSSNLKGKSLYIAQANPFVADDPRGDAVDDAFSATKQVQSTFAEHNTGLQWQYKYYERDNHGSAAGKRIGAIGRRGISRVANGTSAFRFKLQLLV